MEPGTCDLLTTSAPEVPDDNTLLANIMRRLLNGSGMSQQAASGPVRLFLPGGHYTYLTTAEEVEAVQRAQEDRQRGLARRKDRSWSSSPSSAASSVTVPTGTASTAAAAAPAPATTAGGRSE